MSLLSPPLEAFQTIAKQGTVHGAAKVLNLTQTGVTQRVRALEKSLGTTLFTRSRKGMKLTQEGEALLRYCKGALELEGQVLSELNTRAEEVPVHIVIVGPTSVLSSRIVAACAELYSRFPHLHLNFRFDDTPDRLSYVKSGEATLAIVPPELVPNEMDSKKLKSDKYLLVGCPKWKGRKLLDILENERIIDFGAKDFTTCMYLRKFGLLSKVKRDRLFVNNNEAIAKLFSVGAGFGTLTQEIAKPYLDSGDLIALNSGLFVEDPLALVWYPRHEMPEYFQAVIDSVK